MIDLHNAIYNYYLEHLGQLPEDKQFHFASRLYLWSGDESAQKILQRLRPYFTHHDDPSAALRQIHFQSTQSLAHGSKNASELRAPYFARIRS